MNWDFVTSRLATGSDIGTPADVQALLNTGITHVINCRNDPHFIIGTGLSYLWCPTHDDGQPKGVDWFGPGIEFALAALAQPGRRVYVHCQAGQSRGPSMALAILMALGWSLIEAEQLIRARHPSSTLTYKHHAAQAVAALKYI